MKIAPRLNIVAAMIMCSLAAATTFAADAPKMKMTTDIPPGITTPDSVDTSIGTLKYLDGAPYPETAEKAYDFLDTMRGVDAFLKGMPGTSVQGLIHGSHSVGAVAYNQVLIFDKLMDSKSLFLTGNTSTMYVTPDFDLEKTGPMVLEAPAGMLGAFNDAWFRYMQDIGPAGPDKGKGGKYLVLPPRLHRRCARWLLRCSVQDLQRLDLHARLDRQWS